MRLKSLTNYKGGLVGVAFALLAAAGLYFVAFMAAFGNPTPVNKSILSVFGAVVEVAHPLIVVVFAYVLGALLLPD